jgi:hypothetical protein
LWVDPRIFVGGVRRDLSPLAGNGGGPLCKGGRGGSPYLRPSVSESLHFSTHAAAEYSLPGARGVVRRWFPRHTVMHGKMEN